MSFKKASLVPDNGLAQRASWAAVLGLLTATATAYAGCGSTLDGGCHTDELPANDPCFMKGCCETVTLGADGGVIEDAGADAGAGSKVVFCGSCNG